QAKPEHILFWKRSGHKLVTERNSADILHDQEVVPLLFFEVIDRSNVWVTQFAKDFGLSAKPAARAFVPEGIWLKNLDGNFAAKTRVLSQIDFSHSARAYLACYPIAP